MKLLTGLAAIVAIISCNSGEGAGKKTNPNIDAAGLFMTNCASCHKCDVDFTGPALKGAASRWKDKALMYEFMRNPFGVIQKDPYAGSLFKKYNAVMTPTTLSNEEIDAVLEHCNN
ncbi:MAG TPA: cytochrome c [Ferruginibacter sp.]|nr:cytochrome c [Ferruginibacter sp.]